MTPAERALLLEVVAVLLQTLPPEATRALQRARRDATRPTPQALAEALHDAGYHHLAVVPEEQPA